MEYINGDKIKMKVPIENICIVGTEGVIVKKDSYIPMVEFPNGTRVWVEGCKMEVIQTVSEQEDVKRQEKRDLRRTLVTKGAFHSMCCILFLPPVTLGFIITSIVAFIWTLLKGDTNNCLYHFYQNYTKIFVQMLD